MTKFMFLVLLTSMLVAVIPAFITGGVNGLTFFGLIGVLSVAVATSLKERS